MQPSRLNLLSKEKKHHLQQMVYVQFSKHTLEIVLFIVALFGVALIGSEQVLLSYFQSINNPHAANIEQLTEINDKVSYINTTVKRAEIIQSLYTPWSTRMATLVAQTPADVELTGLRVQESTKLLTISGEAATRDALLEYQQALESVDWIASAVIPLSQLTEKDAFPFSIQATLH